MVIKENIGEQADQLVQHERDPTRYQPNPRREKRYQHHGGTCAGRESPLLLRSDITACSPAV